MRNQHAWETESHLASLNMSSDVFRACTYQCHWAENAQQLIKRQNDIHEITICELIRNGLLITPLNGVV